METIKIVGKKVSMTQLPSPAGKFIPTTAIKIFQGSSVLDFQEGEEVKVSGISKGKGFAGVIKKYHFSRGRMTHGGGYPHRLIGSMGGGRGTNQGIPKGKKMPGRMGGKKVTQKSEIIKIDKEKQIIFLRGGIPGPRKGEIILKKL
jgi:large subunit ribosomal protein L3